ncbi:MAG: hypothetical protein WC426_14070 [Sulfuriferula sp.]
MINDRALLTAELLAREPIQLRYATGLNTIGLTELVGSPPAKHELLYSGLLPSSADVGMGVVGMGALLQQTAPWARKVLSKPQIIGGTRGAWSPSAPVEPIPLRVSMAEPMAEQTSTRMDWGLSSPLMDSQRNAWGESISGYGDNRAPWSEYVRMGDSSNRSDWTISKPVDASNRLSWSIYTRRRDASQRSAWFHGLPVDVSKRTAWELLRPIESSARSDWTKASRIDKPERFPFGIRKPLSSGWGVIVEPGGPPVNQNGTIIVPARRIYLVSNLADIVRVSDGQPLEAITSQFGIDENSWGWTFNATLTGRMWPEVQPGGTNGDPVILQISINGYPVKVIVESATRGRSFGKTTVSISGRGIAAALADPIAPVQTFGQTADRTAQQLMNDVLTNTGWGIDWQVTDWLVPNGTFSKTGTPIDALTSIAGTIDAVIQADRTAQIIHVKPRYKIAPWNWATSTPDLQLPLDPIFIDSLDRADNPDYNRVFVMGTTGAGRIGQITRDGTAGNLIAPSVSDPLITAVEASQQRGLAILGAAGKGWKVGVTGPVSADVPMLEDGQLIQLDPTGENQFGMVRGIQLSADASNGLTVRQQATLEIKS